MRWYPHRVRALRSDRHGVNGGHLPARLGKPMRPANVRPLPFPASQFNRAGGVLPEQAPLAAVPGRHRHALVAGLVGDDALGDPDSSSRDRQTGQQRSSRPRRGSSRRLRDTLTWVLTLRHGHPCQRSTATAITAPKMATCRYWGYLPSSSDLARLCSSPWSITRPRPSARTHHSSAQSSS